MSPLPSRPLSLRAPEVLIRAPGLGASPLFSPRPNLGIYHGLDDLQQMVEEAVGA